MRNKSYIYPLIITVAAVATTVVSVAQDSKKIDEQKRKIEQIEKRIADGEKALSSIKKGKSQNQARVNQLSRQIENRSDLLDEIQDESNTLKSELSLTQKRADSLDSSLSSYREKYAEMVRESYRNYKHNNYLSYLIASENFSDVMRRIANIRAVAQVQELQMQRVKTTSELVMIEKQKLDQKKRSVDSVSRVISSQREKLNRDASQARAEVNKLSRREKEVLRSNQEQERQLNLAVNELRKLVKGNKEGSSFTRNTSGLRLPVSGGNVKKYRGNMAEVVGPKDAKIISIYDGKVAEIKRNRISNKYDVYIAHGEYISSYANLSSVTVQKGGIVKSGQAIGVIGSSVDVATMKPEYKMVFGIYSPSPKEVMSAAKCFKK